IMVNATQDAPQRSLAPPPKTRAQQPDQSESAGSLLDHDQISPAESDSLPETKEKTPVRSADLMRALLKSGHVIERIVIVLVVILVCFILFFVLRKQDTQDYSSASLRLSCNIPGARIYFDDKPLGVLEQKTYILQKLPVGEHELFIKADGYKDYIKQLNFSQNEEKVLEVEIKPYSGILSVAANMGNVQISLKVKNVKYTGKNIFKATVLKGSTPENPRPYLLDDIPIGSYILEATKQNYKSFTQPVTIVKDQITTVYVALPEMTVQWKLAVTSNVSGAQIFIDGENRGLTKEIIPTTLLLNPGIHSVIIRKEGFQEFTKELEILSDLPLFANLQSATLEAEESIGGTILIYSNVSGVVIFLDGHRIQKTQDQTITIRGIPPGTHELVAIKSGYKLVTKEIDVKKDVITSFDLEMVLSKPGQDQAESDVSS
ncbi:PEGA domain-containing protein, partial [candidate division CSSED10-310 bacterium]